MEPIPIKPKLHAQWTNDCCGKKSYDAPVIEISTRYWPRDGEFKPSANSSLIVVFKDGGDHGYADLASERFEGESLENVKAQVEGWAQAQMDRVVEALRKEFKV